MNMKRKSLIIVAGVAALVVLGGVYFGSPSKAPPNQKPLLTLSEANFGEFVAAFDGAAEGPRLLLLFSPT
jgi:hypothetical protein